MGKIILKIKGQEPKTHEVEELTVNGFKKGMKIVKKILDEFKNNGNLQDLLAIMTTSDEGLTEEDLVLKDNKFGESLANSFGFLVEEVPELITSLLAVVTDVEEEILDNQPIETLFDLFDQFVEVNDMEKLVKRVKKSLALTQIKWQIAKTTK